MNIIELSIKMYMHKSVKICNLNLVSLENSANGTNILTARRIKRVKPNNSNNIP